SAAAPPHEILDASERVIALAALAAAAAAAVGTARVLGIEFWRVRRLAGPAAHGWVAGKPRDHSSRHGIVSRLAVGDGGGPEAHQNYESSIEGRDSHVPRLAVNEFAGSLLWDRPVHSENRAHPSRTAELACLTGVWICSRSLAARREIKTCGCYQSVSAVEAITIEPKNRTALIEALLAS